MAPVRNAPVPLSYNLTSGTVLTWGFTSGLSLQSAAASDFGGDRVCKRL